MTVIIFLIAILGAVHVDAGAVCTKSLDFTLVVDGSDSICGGTQTCPRWKAILDFCQSIVSALTIGKDNTEVAFVTLSDTAELKWGLRDFGDKQSLLKAISNVKFPGGELNLMGLASMSTLFTGIYNVFAGDRSSAKNVLVMISDGAPNFPHKVYAAASLAVQLDFTAVFVVCLTPGCVEECASGMASPPKKKDVTYYLVSDYRSLGGIKDSLVKNFCDYDVNLLKTLKDTPKLFF